MISYDVVVPSYKRVKKLTRFIESFKLSNRLELFSLYVYFDNCDEDSYKEISTKYKDINLAVMEKQYRAFRIWNYHMKEKFDTNKGGMFYLCDDTKLSRNCLLNATKYLEKRFENDGVVGVSQKNILLQRGGQGFCQSAMGVIGNKFMERFPDRQVFCPDYISFKADNELGQFAAKIGRFYFAETAELIHYHPRFFPGEKDVTHNIVRDAQVDKDRELYVERHNQKLIWGSSFKRVCPDRDKDIGW